MMSTLSGLIMGMLIAALVTVVYGQQLFSSLLLASDKYPAVKALLQQPQLEPAPVPGDTATALVVAEAKTTQRQESNSGLLEPGQMTGSELSSEPSSELQAATNLKPASEPVPVPRAQPNLEQRWSEYAASADKLPPLGSFPWQRCFQRAAVSYDLPQALLLAIASGESNFDPAARSDKDAIGLMQIRWPTTSRHLGVRRQADLYDPCTNVDAGARYLRELVQRYADNLHLAVAAYNYGPARVAPGQVPEGALWYSHYIYQHLQQVLGLEPSATSELIAAPATTGAGREVLMTFSRAHRARDFIAFLGAEIPGLNLQQQTESLGRHEVVLLYTSEEEKRRAIQAITAAGLEIPGPQSNPGYYL